jgi:hypothetical protein
MARRYQRVRELVCDRLDVGNVDRPTGRERVSHGRSVDGCAKRAQEWNLGRHDATCVAGTPPQAIPCALMHNCNIGITEAPGGARHSFEDAIEVCGRGGDRPQHLSGGRLLL